MDCRPHHGRIRSIPGEQKVNPCTSRLIRNVRRSHRRRSLRLSSLRQPAMREPATSIQNNDDKMTKGRHPHGDLHWARRMPEKIARGDRSGARRHPEKLLRGDQHPSRAKPWTRPRGNDHPRAKLSDNDVQAIRAMFAEGGRTHKAIADKFGVTAARVGQLVRMTSRVSDPKDRRAPPGKAKKVSDAVAHEIRLARLAGASAAELGAKYGLNPKYIPGLLRRRLCLR
jgi:hypothetical protein